MEPTRPLLTVCIPTYNRAGFLQECLDSVVASAAGYEDRIRVLVSDNAGTDGTPQVVGTFTERYPWIRYHRNAQNIGPEANFRLLPEMAETEYFWLVGDDDRLERGAIRRVLEKLAGGVDLVLCNYGVYDRHFEHVLVERRFPIREDMTADSPQALMRRFSVHLGFISVIVMRRGAFLAAPVDEYLSFAEYGHSVMFGAYWGLLPRSKSVVIAEPIVGNRADNWIVSDWYRLFAVGTARVFEALQEWGYPAATVLKAKNGGLRELVLPRLLIQKRDGALPPRVLPLLWRYYRRCPLFWAAVVPVLLTPGGVVRTADRLIARPRRLARLRRRAPAPGVPGSPVQ